MVGRMISRPALMKVGFCFEGIGVVMGSMQSCIFASVVHGLGNQKRLGHPRFLEACSKASTALSILK